MARSGFIDTKRVLVAIVVFQAVALCAITATTVRAFVWSHIGDFRIYERYSEHVMRGDLPYVSFSMEYPPGAIFPITIPRLLLPRDATPYQYRAALIGFNIVCSLLVTVVVVQTTRTLAGIAIRSNEMEPRASHALETGAAAACAMLCVASALILPFRYDVFPVLLSALGLMCALARRPVACGWWLGAGIVTKIYPVIFVPLVLIYFLRSAKPGAARDAVKVAVVSVVPTVLMLLPYAFLGTTAYTSFLRYHKLRGLQIESFWAGVAMLAHRWGLSPATVVHNFGAGHMRSGLSDVLISVQPAISVLTLLGVLGLAWAQLNRQVSDAVRARSLVRLSLALVLTFIAFNKVFSTQFIVWPIALVALAPLVGFKRLPIAMVGMILLTMYGFPLNYAGLRDMAPASVYILNLRNLLVLGMIVPLLRAERQTDNILATNARS